MKPDYETCVLLPFAIVGLVACGSGSDGGAGSEAVVTDIDELISLETQGRDVAIDMLELVDTIHYVGSTLLPSVESMTNGNRTVTVNGNLSASTERLSSESLMVDEGSGDYGITSLQYRKSGEDTLSTIEFSASVNVARLSVDAAMVVDPSLQWTQPGCPTSGRLEISLSPTVNIAVDANGGENLRYTQGENSDTISCTEVSTLVGGNTSSVFLPPLPPN